MTRSYEAASTFAQTSAATAAASRIAALPVSVRRKLRSGVSRFRTQAVRPEKGESAAAGPGAASPLLVNRRGDRLRRPRGRSDSGGRVRVGLVERLVLEQRLGEGVELVAVVAQQVEHVVVQDGDELTNLLVDQLLGLRRDLGDTGQQRPL